MPSTLLVGPANHLTEDVVYALPARLVYLTSNVALQISNTAGGGFGALANSTSGTYVSGGFVQCSTAAAIVYCKA